MAGERRREPRDWLAEVTGEDAARMSSWLLRLSFDIGRMAREAFDAVPGAGDERGFARVCGRVDGIHVMDDYVLGLSDVLVRRARASRRHSGDVGEG